MKYKLLIFDWDGTLMDSTQKIVNCFQYAARDCKIQVPSAKLVEYQIGLSLEKAWERIFTELAIRADKALLAQVSERYRDYFLEIDQTPMPLFAGVEEGLRTLENAGCLLAVATGKARRGLNKAFEESNLEPRFVYSRCADEAFSKPHPKMLLDILAFCACEPGDALMIGDTTYDMQMAENAGVNALAVAYGTHSVEQLLPLATDGCANEFDDVLNMLL